MEFGKCLRLILKKICDLLEYALMKELEILENDEIKCWCKSNLEIAEKWHTLDHKVRKDDKYSLVGFASLYLKEKNIR